MPIGIEKQKPKSAQNVTLGHEIDVVSGPQLTKLAVERFDLLESVRSISCTGKKESASTRTEVSTITAADIAAGVEFLITIALFDPHHQADSNNIQNQSPYLAASHWVQRTLTEAGFPLSVKWDRTQALTHLQQLIGSTDADQIEVLLVQPERKSQETLSEMAFGQIVDTYLRKLYHSYSADERASAYKNEGGPYSGSQVLTRIEQRFENVVSQAIEDAGKDIDNPFTSILSKKLELVQSAGAAERFARNVDRSDVHKALTLLVPKHGRTSSGLGQKLSAIFETKKSGKQTIQKEDQRLLLSAYDHLLMFIK